ncbi:hypothetical protein L1987_22519 [Smallanthus sonchifolius]|uniref:Uncharacterized protein n=1 Tax=Smallanthus sonchifolius TaxID=185202 RepID=A0ACB9IF25_9ASTR|nr:hypothetical protein L1987_22519 [Smallanthus sonchifolius]
MVVELVRNHVRAYLNRWYRSASRHPLLVFMIVVLILTYRTFPVLFSLLVYASPVIASTLVLLGTLLFYGHANAPEIQKEEKSHNHDIQSLVFRGMGNTEIDDHKSRSSIDSCVSRGNKKLTQDSKSELSIRKPGLVNRGDGSRRSSFDPLGHMDDDHKGWESGSDVVGSSSPSASVVDVFPMLDELHPLLDSGEIGNETDDDDGHEDIEVKDDDDEEEEESVMNMGRLELELERNQRLESLIARQKAIKNMRMQAEKNMVYMSPDIHFIDTHVSTSRNNPFDLPNIMPRRKSIDLSYDLLGGKPDRPRPNFQSDSVAFGPRTEEDSGDSDDEEVGLAERLKAWLTGW